MSPIHPSKRKMWECKGYKENSAPHLINEDWCSYPDLRIALIIGHCMLWSSIFCPKHRAVNAVIFFWCPVFSIRQCMVWSSIFCCSVIITGQCMLKSSLFCCSVLIIGIAYYDPACFVVLSSSSDSACCDQASFVVDIALLKIWFNRCSWQH